MKDVRLTDAQISRLFKKVQRARFRIRKVERNCAASGEMSQESLVRCKFYRELVAALRVLEARLGHALSQRPLPF